MWTFFSDRYLFTVIIGGSASSQAEVDGGVP